MGVRLINRIKNAIRGFKSERFSVSALDKYKLLKHLRDYRDGDDLKDWRDSVGEVVKAIESGQFDLRGEEFVPISETELALSEEIEHLQKEIENLQEFRRIVETKWNLDNR